jgi:hypothetical protein
MIPMITPALTNITATMGGHNVGNHHNRHRDDHDYDDRYHAVFLIRLR